MEDIEHIPQELQLKPKCLIALTGLDIENNSSHASVWKEFSHNRGHERAPFKLRNLPLDHEYPKPKLKHAAHYEWFLPKGLLKRKWMKKHLNELPAAIAIFFDLEWDEKQWEEKMEECGQRVDLVRSKSKSPNTKIVVVLLQKHVRVGDDLNSTERAQNLCLRCQLPVKYLFVLQLTDFVFGYITRLEAELHDMVSSYYHNAAKRVKINKSNLNKPTHQLLLVRHEFKIAFFDELKQDPNLALKHYRQAYNHLIELNMTDAHLLEFKIVAAFINYKICRLFFQLNAPEAIAQFRRHIDFFKAKIGMPEVAFEHETWLSKQFEVFGELFDEATRVVVTPLIWQHPGLYFLEAARHGVCRRQLAQQLCTSVPRVVTLSSLIPDHPSGSQPPSLFGGLAIRVDPSPIVQPEAAVSTSPPVEFFGQRAWRNAGQNAENLEPAKENEGIMAVKKKETLVCHSNTIIHLLTCACRHFERNKITRMRLYPSFLIAEEYFLKEEYENALSNYSKIVEDFRKSGWAFLFTSVCFRILECALKTLKYSTALSAALELIGNYSTLSPTAKEQIQESVLRATAPPQVDWSIGLIEPSIQTNTISSEIIDLTLLYACVEVKVEFIKSSFTIDEPVYLLVYFKSFAPSPLSFDSVTVKLINDKTVSSPTPGYPSTSINEEVCSTAAEWSLPVNLASSTQEHLKVIVFTLDPSTLTSRVRVKAVEAVIAYPSAGCRYRVRWSIPTLSSFSERQSITVACNYMANLDALKLAMTARAEKTEDMIVDIYPIWDYFVSQPVAEITPRKSQLEISLRHTPPVLCNERYAILCQVHNTEPSELISLNISATLSDSGSQKASENLEFTSLQATNIITTERLGQVGVGQDKLSSFDAINMPVSSFTWPDDLTLSVGNEFVCPIYIRCPAEGDRSLRVDATYTLSIQLPSGSADLFSLLRVQESDSSRLQKEVSQTVAPKPTGNQMQATCLQSKRVQLSTVAPFDISSRILSLQNVPITTVITGKAFILEVMLTNSSPWNIEVDSSSFTLGPGVQFVDGTMEVQITAVCLQPYECVSEVQLIIVPDSPEFQLDIVNLGHYHVQWRRIRPHTIHDSNFPRSSSCSTVFQLLSAPLAHLPYDVDLKLPPYVLLNKPFSLAYTIVNKTPFLQELNARLEPVNYFIFCGSQFVTMRLLPNTSKKLDFTLLPLAAGYLELPRFQMCLVSKSVEDPEEMPLVEIKSVGGLTETVKMPHSQRLSAKTQMLQQLRSHIFVMPNREVALTD